MLKSIEAIFDGEVFRPAEQIELDGPPDWSLKLDDYLYAAPDSNAR